MRRARFISGGPPTPRAEMPTRPVSVFVRSVEPMVDRHGARYCSMSRALPPECEAQRLRNRIPGQAQIASGIGRRGRNLRTVECRRRERRAGSASTFRHLLRRAQAGPERANLLSAASGVEHAFPAIVAGASGDVRVAWMDARTTEAGHTRLPLWNTYLRSSTNGGATWGAEVRLSGAAVGYDYIQT